MTPEATPRPTNKLSASIFSLSFVTRVAPHCVNTLMILHAAHTTLSLSLSFAPAVALRARSPEGVVVGWRAQTPAAIGRGGGGGSEGSQACVGRGNHVAACFICVHSSYAAPRPRGSATPAQGCVRRHSVVRAAPAQRGACGCGDLAGVPPGERAGGHLGSCGVKTTKVTSAETVWCVCAAGARSLCST